MKVLGEEIYSFPKSIEELDRVMKMEYAIYGARLYIF